MNEERVRQIVRNFPENGLKQVLTTAGNVRDLLALAKAEVLPRLDFAAMQVDPTTYVTAEYRNVTSDLLLTLPLLPARKGGRRRRLMLSILIELQMQPDRIMLLRVLEYLVQIWKHQVKQHGDQHKSLASVKLTPILPVVLHTGSYSWDRMGTLLDLMDDAEMFRAFTPAFAPLFVSLPDKDETELETDGGFLGQVLALIRARPASRTAFAERLDRTVTRVQELPDAERLRRRELLCYVEGVVYHWRGENEHPLLRERIDAALKDDEDRLEMAMVRKTMAQAEAERYTRAATLTATLAERKRTLVNQLKLRFAPLPSEIEQTVESTQDADQLAQWLDRFATADDLDSIGILPRRRAT